MKRDAAYKPGLAWFSAFALLFTCLPLAAGGFTTSIQAGMAFLDWPLSNGSLNPDGWLQDSHQRAEHSHRLLAMVLGLISIALVAWTQCAESRTWVRRLALGILGMVIFQGLLGGLRVLLDQLNIQSGHNLIAQSFAVMHAVSAQFVVILLVSLSLATTRSWIERQAGLTRPIDPVTRVWGIAAVISLLIQVALGAVMRHGHAGLAIPTFPLTPEGGLLPRYWDFAVGIHFAHRVGAVVVTGILLVFFSRLWGSAQARRAFIGYILAGIIVLAFQIYLGALTIWTVKNPHAATAHALTGALLIACTYALTFLSHRLSSNHAEADSPGPETAPAAVAPSS